MWTHSVYKRNCAISLVVSVPHQVTWVCLLSTGIGENTKNNQTIKPPHRKSAQRKTQRDVETPCVRHPRRRHKHRRLPREQTFCDGTIRRQQKRRKGQKSTNSTNSTNSTTFNHASRRAGTACKQHEKQQQSGIGVALAVAIQELASEVCCAAQTDQIRSKIIQN